MQTATRAQHQILMPTTSMFSLPSPSHDVADVTERSPIHEKHEVDDEHDRFAPLTQLLRARTPI